MLASALTLAAAVSLTLGGDVVAPVEAATAPTPAASAPAARPQFTLGAGDALGVRIRVNDIILARRLDAERTRFANVPDQD